MDVVNRVENVRTVEEVERDTARESVSEEDVMEEDMVEDSDTSVDDETPGQTLGTDIPGKYVPGDASHDIPSSTGNISVDASSVNSMMSDFSGGMNSGVVLGAVVASLIISILVFVFVVERKKAPKGKFMKWLREYLNFRSILISGIIKFVFLFSSVLLTIMSFIIMVQGEDDTRLMMVLTGLAMLIFGNILLRITMEMTMIMIGVWNNTSDIRAVVVKEEEKPQEDDGEKKMEEPVVAEESVSVEESVVAEKPVVAEEPKAMEASAVKETVVEKQQTEM